MEKAVYWLERKAKYRVKENLYCEVRKYLSCLDYKGKGMARRMKNGKENE